MMRIHWMTCLLIGMLESAALAAETSSYVGWSGKTIDYQTAHKYFDTLDRIADLKAETARIKRDTATQEIQAGLENFTNGLKAIYSEPSQSLRDAHIKTQPYRDLFTALRKQQDHNKVVSPLVNMIASDFTINLLYSPMPISIGELIDVYDELKKTVLSFIGENVHGGQMLILYKIFSDPITGVEFDELRPEEQKTLWEKVL